MARSAARRCCRHKNGKWGQRRQAECGSVVYWGLKESVNHSRERRPRCGWIYLRKKRGHDGEGTPLGLVCVSQGVAKDQQQFMTHRSLILPQFILVSDPPVVQIQDSRGCQFGSRCTSCDKSAQTLLRIIGWLHYGLFLQGNGYWFVLITIPRLPRLILGLGVF